MAYIVVWTVQTELADRYEYEDFYVVYGDEDTAQKGFRLLLEEESVWCAAITKVVDATEPQWLDGSTYDESPVPVEKDT